MEKASGQQSIWNKKMDINKYPRDLLRDFMSDKDGNKRIINGGETEREDESAIELNLGLSLGGRFGVDKTPKKLKRSSSVLGTVQSNHTTVVSEAEPENYKADLSRTTSLPAEMEEEWKKRKEIQSLWIMEAKRRCERQIFQDSNGGRKCSSSTLSKAYNKNQQGSTNTYGNKRCPKIKIESSSNNGSYITEKSTVTRANKETEKRVRTQDSAERKCKEMAAPTGLFDMPCVFTRGDGPIGKRVDGILYKYGKGEKVRIMCICHGSFLTPAEFVKHSGGGDVDRPLRHIVVNTSSSSF